MSTSGYSIHEVEAFGNRLHFNTILSLICNTFVTYLIIKHSTPAMGIYKYYIFSTVFFAFFMDFHLTFIWGIFPLFSSLITCPAGISKYLGSFFGNTVQFAVMHYTISFCELSVFSGFLYQYLSIVKQNNILQTRQGVFILSIFCILYSSPAFILYIINLCYSKTIENFKLINPNFYSFLKSASCDGFIFSKLTILYSSIGITLNALIYIFGSYLGFRIWKNLKEIRNQLSVSTLKMSQQFFVVLVIQMIIPLIFIMIPMFFLAMGILFQVENMNAFNQVFVQIMTLHSVANALTIMFVIKPYRQTIHKWYKRFFCCSNVSNSSVTGTVEITTNIMNIN